jgi:opacity protein-like surface antigen
MRAVLIAIVLLIAFSIPAKAQEAPPMEVFGGYSYFRPDGGGNFHGWNASVAGNFNRWFGVVGDFSGHYGSESFRADFSDPDLPGTITARSNSDTSVHFVLFGPRISSRKHEKLTPFAHALFGLAHLRTKAILTLGDLSSEISFADTSFAVAIGGGVDLKLSESIGLRLIQADYMRTRFGNSSQNNARLSVGIVFH